MKNRIIGLLLFSVFLTLSCTKEEIPPTPTNNTGPYYVRFKADGVLREYTYQPSLLATTSGSASQYIMITSTFNLSDDSNVAIQIFDGQPIAPGTFSGYALVGSYFQGGILSHKYNGISYGTNGANPEVEIVLTEWTITEAKGTFSGVVKNLTGSETLTLTEGEFFVKRGN